jgi:hypothetical protein
MQFGLWSAMSRDGVPSRCLFRRRMLPLQTDAFACDEIYELEKPVKPKTRDPWESM